MATEIFKKPVTEMSDEEILAEIKALRDRRASTRQSAEVRKATGSSNRAKKGPGQVTGALQDTMADILGDVFTGIKEEIKRGQGEGS